MAAKQSQRDRLRTHDLSAVVVYAITVKEALGDTAAMLTKESIKQGPIVGCYACEQPLPWCKDHECPGQPTGRLEYVE